MEAETTVYESANPSVVNVENRDNVRVVPMTKPIRISQFLLVTILFGITIWFVSTKPTEFDIIAANLLTLLFGSFWFIALIDIISQCGGDPIPNTPMFLFGLVGAALFLAASGVVIYIWTTTWVWELLLIVCLSATCGIFYLLDVFFIALYGY